MTDMCVCVCVMASPDVEWFPPVWVLIRHGSIGTHNSSDVNIIHCRALLLIFTLPGPTYSCPHLSGITHVSLFPTKRTKLTTQSVDFVSGGQT